MPSQSSRPLVWKLNPIVPGFARLGLPAVFHIGMVFRTNSFPPPGREKGRVFVVCKFRRKTGRSSGRSISSKEGLTDALGDTLADGLIDGEEDADGPLGAAEGDSEAEGETDAE